MLGYVRYFSSVLSPLAVFLLSCVAAELPKEHDPWKNFRDMKADPPKISKYKKLI